MLSKATADIESHLDLLAKSWWFYCLLSFSLVSHDAVFVDQHYYYYYYSVFHYYLTNA